MNAADDLAVLARVTASLVVVVALAVLAARFARRAGVRGGGAGLRVVERTGLSREASVAVVEVGGRALVVGVTSQGVSLLTELTAAELAAATAPADPAGSPTGDVPGIVAGPRRIVVRPERGGFGTGSDGSRMDGYRADGYRADGYRGTGSVLDPRTWRSVVDALRDLTARRG